MMNEKAGTLLDAKSGEPYVIPVRHPSRWAAASMVIALAVLSIQSMATNPRFQWGVVRQYLFSQTILNGLLLTIELTVISMAVGISLGILLAVMRQSANFVLRWASGVYIWLFRGTPVLVQILFFYNIAALYPRIRLGVPFGPALVNANTNVIVSTWAAAILALGLNEAAYMAEISRAGLLSIDRGQRDAAKAIGMGEWQSLRRIVLPQAMRVIVPPTGNECISMLKTTSLVSVISLMELLYSAQIIYTRTFDTVPLLIVASIWYIAVTSVLMIIQIAIESRFGRGFTPRSEAASGFRSLIAALPWHRIFGFGRI